FQEALARRGGVQTIIRDGHKLHYRWNGEVQVFDRRLDPRELVDLADPTAANITQILSDDDFENIFGDGDDNIGFRAFTLGNDGLVYAYEDDSDSIFRFDPAAASSTLELVLTDAELSSQVGSDIISGLIPYGDSVALYNIAGDPGLYAIVPEPTSLAVLAFAGLALKRRRTA
ncbi:MAG: PEP-CTERM sorting domain-containing protein, partial [Planctomycetota bacterium]